VLCLQAGLWCPRSLANSVLRSPRYRITCAHHNDIIRSSIIPTHFLPCVLFPSIHLLTTSFSNTLPLRMRPIHFFFLLEIVSVILPFSPTVLSTGSFVFFSFQLTHFCPGISISLMAEIFEFRSCSWITRFTSI